MYFTPSDIFVRQISAAYLTLGITRSTSWTSDTFPISAVASARSVFLEVVSPEERARSIQLCSLIASHSAVVGSGSLRSPSMSNISNAIWCRGQNRLRHSGSTANFLWLSPTAGSWRLTRYIPCRTAKVGESLSRSHAYSGHRWLHPSILPYFCYQVDETLEGRRQLIEFRRGQEQRRSVQLVFHFLLGFFHGPHPIDGSIEDYSSLSCRRVSVLDFGQSGHQSLAG